MPETSVRVRMMSRQRLDAEAAMKRVALAVAAEEDIDPEDLVVIRGASETFAELAERYIELRNTKQ